MLETTVLDVTADLESSLISLGNKNKTLTISVSMMNTAYAGKSLLIRPNIKLFKKPELLLLSISSLVIRKPEIVKKISTPINPPVKTVGSK